MAKFSDRIGVTTPPSEFQKDSMSPALRNSLWNLFYVSVGPDWYRYLRLLYQYYFKLPVNDVPSSDYHCQKWLQEKFMALKWYEVYNLMEFGGQCSKSGYEQTLNEILKSELSAYRSVNRELVPITDEQEIESIREAASSPFDGVRLHISNALHLLGKKPEPDYRNSIKESISAVEGICKLLTGEKSGGIDNALKKLSEKAYFHPAFQKSISSLYGYTSDEGGIRHPILEMKDKDVGFPEAKFMLVACSAFVYLITDKAREAGLL